MTVLSELWTSRLRVIVANLAEGQHEHREIANLSREISRDYHGRCLIELLQNAGDQAAQAKLTDSTVTIVRTEDLLAVANTGLPFDSLGIERITSMGVSPKDASETIGNKGVGFKAVYQVTNAPEIYSSAVEGGLLPCPPTRFCMTIWPFDDPSLQAVLQRTFEVSRREDRATIERLCHRHRSEDLWDFVMAEVRKSAPFKFPLPLATDAFEQRIAALGLTRDLLADASTLIVLPIRAELPPAVVDDAIDGVVGLSNDADSVRLPGTTILFLPGVARVVTYDRVRQLEREVLKTELPRTHASAAGVRYVRTEAKSEGASTAARAWWVLSNTLGEASPYATTEVATRQQVEIAAAVAGFEGESWHRVRTAMVSVALPQPDPHDEAGTPLGAHGRICIGLPTLDATGSPFWVDGRFYGTISRKGIDLKSIPYNLLLFDEADRLASELVKRLQAQEEPDVRRAATLALERNGGPLADRFARPGGLAKQAVVLSADGLCFLEGRELSLPATEDTPMFLELIQDVEPSELAVRGFALPDRALLIRAREILEQLGAEVAGGVGVLGPYVSRPGGSESLLERGARLNRARGVNFFHRFFDWLLHRFEAGALADQRILPIGEGELASQRSRVFLRPRTSSTADVEVDADEEAPPEEIPEIAARALRFIDERAVQIRESDGRSLTALARRLAPDEGEGLVRRARLADLINQALAPSLQEAAADANRQDVALSLLAQAIQWVWRMKPRSLSSIRADQLRAPVPGDDGQWAWAPPDTVYFGRGWFDDDASELLLQRAYGGMPRQRLIPWEELAPHLARGARERALWAEGLERLGVAKAPRIISAPRRRPAGLVSRSYECLDRNPGVSCPLAGTRPYWERYLEEIRRRSARTRSGQQFDVVDLCWVDGLERDDAREAVFDLMLRYSERYEQRLSTSLQRWDPAGDRDGSPVESLWVHALRTPGWPIVPVNQGGGAMERACPRDAWWLDADQRRKPGARLLRVVPPYHVDARRVLKAIGVVPLSEAPAERLIEALQALAATLDDPDEAHGRDANSLAYDFYARLQRRCAEKRGEEDLSAILAKPMPLLEGRRLVPVDLSNPDVTVYVADDPIRARYVPTSRGTYRLPLGTRTRHGYLLTALRVALGTERVRRTSDAEVDTGFQPSGDSAAFLEFLEGAYKGYPDLVVDLALLVRYGEEVPDDEAEEGDDRVVPRFRETWSRITAAQIQFGRFLDPTRVFYDSRENTLQVAEDLRSLPDRVLEESRQLVPEARGRWTEYARLLGREPDSRRMEAFFAELQIGPHEREAIEVELGRSDRMLLDKLLPTFFAVWTRRRGRARAEEFLAEWTRRIATPADVADWLDEPALRESLAAVRGLPEGEADLVLLRALGLSVAEWQAARQALGRARHRFAETLRRFTEVVVVLGLGLRSIAAHSEPVELTRARELIERLNAGDAPDDLAEDVPRDEAVVQATLDWAARLLKDAAGDPSCAVLLRRVEEMKAERPAGLSAVHEQLRRFGATDREMNLYRDRDEHERSVRALAEIDAVVRVAQPLATKFRESFDARSLHETPRVVSLTHGWWANRFAALGALRSALEQTAPGTVAALTRGRAFHGDVDGRWEDLWRRFPELGPLPVSQTPSPRRQAVRVLGETRTIDEIEMDLAHGAAGVVGQQLAAAVDPTLDLAAFRKTREKLKAKVRSGDGRKRVPGGGLPPGSSAERDMDGLVGEAFLFEQLRRSLPNFDDECWISENRTRYGLPGEGTAGRGFDFLYRDSEGLLSGLQEDRLCYIECKATSGEGDRPFIITAKEWEVAGECHRDHRGPAYVLVRVENVLVKPRIADIIVDPYALRVAGELFVVERDLWVHVGKPEEEEQDGA